MRKTKFQILLDNVPEETKQFVGKQNEIASQISSILQHKGIKQKEFAAKIGMKESQLSKILSGNANITLKTITKIESALGEDIIFIPLFIKPEKELIIRKINIINLNDYYTMKWSDDYNMLPTETGYQQKVKSTAVDSKILGVA